MKKSIYLSPSTQEKNIGYGNYGSEEMVMNQITDSVQAILERHGLVIYRNRPEWDLKKVVAESNSKKPDIHFAIHSNAGGGRGCEIYAYAPGGKGEKLARAVYTGLEPLTPTADRGVKFNPNLYELRMTTAPAALVEVAFHDNPEDAVWNIRNIEPIGNGIAQGILRYFGTSVEEPKLFSEAVELLQSKGIVNSPEYWLKNAKAGRTVNGEYAATLIERVAAFILRGGK